jgi:hypothetical protein
MLISLAGVSSAATCRRQIGIILKDLSEIDFEFNRRASPS